MVEVVIGTIALVIQLGNSHQIQPPTLKYTSDISDEKRIRLNRMIGISPVIRTYVEALRVNQRDIAPHPTVI